MKRNALAFFACIAVIFTSVAFQQKQKTYTFILDEQQVNELFYVVGKTTAEHTIYVSVQSNLNKQLQPQLDTTKVKAPK
jgi:hypothetical protein